MNDQQQKADVEIGRTYRGKVKNVVPFGIFVEILPGREGLCHISEFDHFRIASLDDHVKVGDMVDVMFIGTNDRGQLRLSRKATLPRPANAPTGNGNGNGGGGGGRDRGDREGRPQRPSSRG